MYILGLDGGGTKTDMALCDESGCVISRAIGGAASLTGQTQEAAFGHIEETMCRVTAPIGGEQAEIAAFFAGISGGGLAVNREKFRALFARLLPNARVRENASDAVNALSAGIGRGDGVIAIAGTGSSVFARAKGEMRQVGGWGYLLGDEGSGFDLGRRALTAALRGLDGRGEATCLRAMCEEKAGCTLRELIVRLYTQDSKRVIASYAPLLLEAAERGDSAALAELSRSTGEMAHAIATAAAYCEKKRVVMGGSVWKSKIYRESVERALGEGYEMIAPSLPPVYGSIVEAAGLAGLEVTQAFKDNFRETLTEE